MRQLAAVDALAFTEDGLRAADRGQDRVAAARRVRDRRAVRRAARTARALARYGERLGMAFQIADDMLDYTETAGRDREAGRARPARAQGDAAAHRRAAAADAGAARDGSTRCSRPRRPATSRLREVVAHRRPRPAASTYARRRGEQFAREAEEALRGLPGHAGARRARRRDRSTSWTGARNGHLADLPSIARCFTPSSLAIGFIVGGVLTQVARRFLPAGRGEGVPHDGRRRPRSGRSRSTWSFSSSRSVRSRSTCRC